VENALHVHLQVVSDDNGSFTIRNSTVRPFIRLDHQIRLGLSDAKRNMSLSRTRSHKDQGVDDIQAFVRVVDTLRMMVRRLNWSYAFGDKQQPALSHAPHLHTRVVSSE
jgi:hypothetical protein